MKKIVVILLLTTFQLATAGWLDLISFFHQKDKKVNFSQAAINAQKWERNKLFFKAPVLTSNDILKELEKREINRRRLETAAINAQILNSKQNHFISYQLYKKASKLQNQSKKKIDDYIESIQFNESKPQKKISVKRALNKVLRSKDILEELEKREINRPRLEAAAINASILNSKQNPYHIISYQLYKKASKKLPNQSKKKIDDYIKSIQSNKSKPQKKISVKSALNKVLRSKDSKTILNIPKQYKLDSVNENVPTFEQPWLHFLLSKKFLIGGNNIEDKECLLATALILWGADINRLDDKRRTPLHCALRDTKHLDVRKNKGYSNLKMVQLLIDTKADINAQDKKGNTPLHYAIKRRNPAAITLLLDYGANPNIQNEKGETPLLFAIKRTLEIQHHADSFAHQKKDPFVMMDLPYNESIKAMLQTKYRPIINLDLKDKGNKDYKGGNSVRSILNETYQRKNYKDTIRLAIEQYETFFEEKRNNLNDSFMILS